MANEEIAEPTAATCNPVPSDYGLGIFIDNDATVATGDRDLVLAHASLEAKRLELNYCVKQGSERFQQRAIELRAELNRALPKFAAQLNSAIAQGKYNPTQHTASGLDYDMPLTPTQSPEPGQRHRIRR